MSHTKEISINNEVQNETIVISKYCTTLSIIFLDIFNVPIINTEISIINKEDNSITFNVISDEEGKISLNNILYGNYEITIN